MQFLIRIRYCAEKCKGKVLSCESWGENSLHCRSCIFSQTNLKLSIMRNVIMGNETPIKYEFWVVWTGKDFHHYTMVSFCKEIASMCSCCYQSLGLGQSSHSEQLHWAADLSVTIRCWSSIQLSTTSTSCVLWTEQHVPVEVTLCCPLPEIYLS